MGFLKLWNFKRFVNFLGMHIYCVLKKSLGLTITFYTAKIYLIPSLSLGSGGGTL